LWSFYLFRFSESPATSDEQLNRPLAMKISDVKSPLYRAGLNVMANGRLFPRAYIWGMADTIRAGAEGRAISIRAFGSLYYNKAPFYYFPGAIVVKLPLGLLLLTAIGTGLFIARRTPRELVAPLVAVIVLAILFLLVLIKGSSYAGIRHALPVIPPLALLGSLAIHQAIKHKSYLLRGAVAVAILGALLSAIPALRPWEYFNELVGGAANGHRYFNDEGVDSSLRTEEIIDYYNQNLKPNGEIPYVIYFSPQIEWRRRGLDWVGKEPERDAAKIFSPTLSGTFIIGANELAPALWWDIGKHFREATPIARFGNIFIFRGTFPGSPAAQARVLYILALRRKIYVAEPDIEGGIEMLSRSVALDPAAFFVALELGNQYLKIGNREEALRAYRIARENAPASDDIGALLARQIERVQTEPLEQIHPLRNPALE
jgi:tetratricopeptide (TPR) repeat protein